MNKKILLAVLVVVVLGASAFFIWQGKLHQNEAANTSEQVIDSSQNKEMNTAVDAKQLQKIIPSDGKTYTNTKLGFSFQYPSTWLMDGSEVEAVNLKGSVTSVEVNFSDTVSPTTLLVTCHLTKGAELYQYAVSQFKAKQGWYVKDAKEIEIAGTVAVEANMISTMDGKGNQLNTPIRLIVVDLLNKKRGSEIQLQFKTPVVTEEKVGVEFNRLLAGFKFIE